MVNWVKDLFAESSTVSMTRFLAFVCVLTSTLIAFYGTYKNQDVTALVAVFLGAGMTGKVVQKSLELKAAANAKE